ncbi:MAG: type IV pilus assembly protein PilM [Candidatus Spechtbacterales bacterium]
MIKSLKIIPPAFGLDISDSSLKFVQLKPKGKHYSLAFCGEAELPKGIVEGGHIIKPEELSKLLRNILSPYVKKGLSEYAMLSLPDEEVFLKTMYLPEVGEGELRNVVQVEAERNMPIQVEKTYLDYYPLKAGKYKKGQGLIPRNSEKTKKKNTNFLVAAANKEAVDMYSEIVTEAGLTPAIIEPEVCAIGRSVIKDEYSENPIIIAEIGANRTRLITFLHNSVILTASANFSADEATAPIAKAMGITEQKARELKWDNKLLKNAEYGEKINEALASLFYHLGESINNYLGFLNESYKGKDINVSKVEKIIISGGGAKIPGIDKQLSMILHIPVETANPWVNVLPYPLKETPELSRDESVRYTTAIGLASRGARENGIF